MAAESGRFSTCLEGANIADTTTRKPGIPAGIPTLTTTSTPTRQFRDLIGDAADLLHGLFDRARDNLSDDDLASLSAAGDAAQSAVRNLADLCEGLGCLILGDGNTPGVSTGCFQDARSVSSLLFLLSAIADQTDGMLTLATAADNELAAARHAGGAA